MIPPLLTTRLTTRLTIRPAAVLVALVALAAAPSAAGAPLSITDKAAAQALFDDALALMAQDQFDRACPMLEESSRLDPAMGTRYRLAECYEAIGRTASAWAGFLEVADLAHASRQASREAIARERARKLEPALARVEITVESPTAGLEIRRDGAVVGEAQWGAKIPVDPGRLHVTASAPGHTPWERDVVIPKGTAVVSLRVPALDALPAPPAPRAPPPAAHSPDARPALSSPSPPASTAGPASGRAQPEHPSATRRTVGAALFLAGAAGIVASGALTAVALARYHGADDRCPGDVCDPQGKEATDSARNLATIATVAFGAGAAFATGGAVLWLSARARPPLPAPGGVRARLRVGPGGLAVEGTF
jgi:hypothetical protein